MLTGSYGSAMTAPPGPVDTSFDMRTDAAGRDPDSHSKTLRRYHQQLWSKPLPSGAMFDLDDKLHHLSDLGEYWLSSDGIVHTYSTLPGPQRLLEVLAKVPTSDVADFYALACTVGGYVVFPAQVHVDGRWHLSINQCRGMHPRIRDRFDLTLECIRRHYEGSQSPLSGCFGWHAGFFALFGDFPGYIDYFLLNDLVTDDYDVRFMTPFDDFAGSPLPDHSVAEYRQYMQRSMDFVRARNGRIADYVSATLGARE